MEYWFRCLDRDGDGFITIDDIHCFYEEQIDRLLEMGVDSTPFPDMLCQLLDLANPALKSKISCVRCQQLACCCSRSAGSLADLKRCRLPGVFINTLVNVNKVSTVPLNVPVSSRRLQFLAHEERDQFALQKRREDNGGSLVSGIASISQLLMTLFLQPSDWERFAAEQYVVLSQEDENDNSSSSSDSVDDGPLDLSATSADRQSFSPDRADVDVAHVGSWLEP